MYESLMIGAIIFFLGILFISKLVYDRLKQKNVNKSRALYAVGRFSAYCQTAEPNPIEVPSLLRAPLMDGTLINIDKSSFGVYSLMGLPGILKTEYNRWANTMIDYVPDISIFDHLSQRVIYFDKDTMREVRDALTDDQFTEYWQLKTQYIEARWLASRVRAYLKETDSSISRIRTFEVSEVLSDNLSGSTSMKHRSQI